jgi:predicted nucleic acid-binding protein
VTDIVIDASVALGWCFGDELTDPIGQILERLQTSAAAVPALWPLEVANVLLSAERRGRITAADSARLIALLSALDIDIDGGAPSQAFTRILDLAREQGLTAYDAAYLELAMRLGVPLATKDGALIAAAARVGVVVIGGDA